MSSHYSQSFQPILGDKPLVLILGTLPGKESLHQQKYYAHPRNHFWPIVFQTFGAEVSGDYDARVSFAKAKRIALWDVCGAAHRKGSLDADIKEEVPNEIDKLLLENPTIRTVIFNGKKAESLFQKHFLPQEGISYHTCLSTSPANAAYSFEQKLKSWQEALCGITVTYGV